MEKLSFFFIVFCCALSSAVCFGTGFILGIRSPEDPRLKWLAPSAIHMTKPVTLAPPESLIPKTGASSSPTPLPPKLLTSSPHFTLHLGSYSSQEGVQEFIKTLTSRHILTFIEEIQGSSGYPVYLVCSGTYESYDQAMAALQKMDLDKEMTLAINIMELKKQTEDLR